MSDPLIDWLETTSFDRDVSLDGYNLPVVEPDPDDPDDDAAEPVTDARS